MIYLMFAVFCSSSIGIIFKVSEQRESNRYLVTSINYITAVLVSGYLLIRSGILQKIIWINFEQFGRNLLLLMQANEGRLSFDDSSTWAISLGIVTGWFYFIAFIYYQISVRKNGIALSGMFSRLGVLVPMAISIVIWNEIPTTIQTVGIICCLLSIVLVNLNFRKGEVFRINGSLVLLFIYFGIAVFCNKMFQNYALLDLKPLYVFSLFLSAFITSMLVSKRFIRKIQKAEVLIGVAVGIPNMLTAWFLIQALDQIKASVVFPVFSAGTIILMTVVAVLFFKERIHARNGAAILLTTFALVLINL